jgi:uncharacterized protein YkwD
MTQTTRRTGRRIVASTALVVMLVGLVEVMPAGAAPGGGRSTGSTAVGTQKLRVGGDAWQLLKRTNAARERRGLRPVRLDRERSQIARRHSARMAAAGYLFHTTKVSVYLQGIRWHRWGENVGYTSGSVAGLHDAFMASAPHRRNILQRGFRRVAIGTVRVDGRLWATLFFYG